MAIETYLGWTLMGKVPQSGTVNPTLAITVTGLFLKEADVSDLWLLDLIGICNPDENNTKEQVHLDTLSNFRWTAKVNVEGRYEVCLPWKENQYLLCSQWHLPVDHHKKLRAENLYDRYNDVFKERQEEGITEVVSVADNEGHYFPYRPVVKESSITMKIRPVFDTSAKDIGSPSLNDCLEEGPYLTDLIPAVLLWFRKWRVGVSAGIKKALLKIIVNTVNRDYS